MKKKVKIYDCNNPVRRVLFIGNSITLHEKASSIGWDCEWGMAVSSQDKDYVHQVLATLRERFGEIAYCIVNAAEWERNFSDESVLSLYEKVKNFKADTVIFRLGENVNREKLKTEDFASAFERFVRYVAEQAKKVIITDTFWECEAISAPMKEVAIRLGTDFISISDLGYHGENKAIGLFEHKGVASHPGDLGMRRIAERILQIF